ncbi:FAD-dependent oxidoreductase [Jannaschia donghaensis]|uniref:3-(3-hydroxy-phenyl)propionate/3-hydroxycinnamic acid hydroxylase n=1 Tax=Jannaschia donghaensis TaxID=420998 RepID=A0A0M6YM58_9RHOB|nr:FAD-dependent oxidoreductase [Jannaschia donghaensis]CTQ51452.1 3-(3-hydroxy-phenyl)propionate/3-hydroxycinnamic acid hydroxylase [Jannaschia donghaensis]
MVAVRYQTAFRLYPYQKVPAQEAAAPLRHPVVIVGGGPVGMALALDLGNRGTPCLVLDDHDGVGLGSRAICFAKRTLEICDRLGCGERMVDKGVVWNVGRVYRDDREIYAFDLLPETGHKRPAFINLQQPYFEQFLVEEIRRKQAVGAPVEIRGRNAVTGLEQHADHVAVSVDTPDGPYRLEADYLVACDGANSPIRTMMGLDFGGRVFEDNFLIADIRMDADHPVERRFWFDPPFNRGETALMHKQPDDVWRLDFQLGWDIDRKAEMATDKVCARVAATIGADVPFDLVWSSIYTFRCCTMDRYRHGRVFFAGDSAHQVSPFGARGANGGVQDADNLGWKLSAVLSGAASESLLDSYHDERKQAAMENIANSSRAADFLTPRTPAHALFRDAVLDLVERYDFARPMVNSGRLSTPCTYDGSALNIPDGLPNGPSRSRPGSPASDVSLGDSHLLERFGSDFTLLAIGGPAAPVDGCKLVALSPADDESGALADRYLGDAGAAVYLIRPDHHIAARWPAFDAKTVTTAIRAALGGGGA